jgi:hypothetical protein
MFYTFNQNNSGGGFDMDKARGIGSAVVIEADSPSHANERAEEIGLYFDGVEEEIDCECCGDRWYRAWESGTDRPTYYGEELTLLGEGEVFYVHPLEGNFYRMYRR